MSKGTRWETALLGVGVHVLTHAPVPIGYKPGERERKSRLVAGARVAGKPSAAQRVASHEVVPAHKAQIGSFLQSSKIK